mmetsp:Transcript_59684/g.129792  ORF Transcript_59684/g.129792 Transcript_59684/m.129792 type:complete len:192 (+) Transcript_59684:483-1058(+)
MEAGGPPTQGITAVTLCGFFLIWPTLKLVMVGALSEPVTPPGGWTEAHGMVEAAREEKEGARARCLGFSRSGAHGAPTVWIVSRFARQAPVPDSQRGSTHTSPEISGSSQDMGVYERDLSGIQSRNGWDAQDGGELDLSGYGGAAPMPMQFQPPPSQHTAVELTSIHSAREQNWVPKRGHDPEVESEIGFG